MALGLMNPLHARQAPGNGACRIAGHVKSGTTPLPGVAIAVKTADARFASPCIFWPLASL